jgi:predicted AlkP superfamily pyrophosphatase or phosphodiesterase
MPGKLKILTMLLMIIGILVVPGCGKKGKGTESPVVIVCIEAARADMLGRPELTTLQEIRKQGASARALIPVFPANSTPNVASLATGCFPAKHGAVNNRFLERKTGEVFEGKPEEDRGLLRAEPLWVTAERQGIRTAVSNWQGARAPYEGVSPSTVSALRERATLSARVKEFCDFISKGECGLYMIYLDALDKEAHRFGPGSKEEQSAEIGMDRVVSKIRDAAGPKANIFVVADHGMAKVDHCLHLNPYLKALGIEAFALATGGTANLYFPPGGDPAKAAEILKDQARFKDLDPDGIYRVYTPRDLPEASRYIVNDRSGDLILIARRGYYFRERNGGEDFLTPPKDPGMHGFEPEAEGMPGIFLAAGPKIKAGVSLEKVRVVDIYPTVCKLLGIVPAEGIDGKPIEEILAQ